MVCTGRRTSTSISGSRLDKRPLSPGFCRTPEPHVVLVSWSISPHLVLLLPRIPSDHTSLQESEAEFLTSQFQVNVTTAVAGERLTWAKTSAEKVQQITILNIPVEM